jgi:cytochrome c peroxidase
MRFAGPRIAAVLLASTVQFALAQRGGGPAPPAGVVGNQGNTLAPLRTVAVPRPADLARYVRDETALIALGKAFFWDMQAGSDGTTACATCHFHAGADHRLQNQLASPHNGSYALAPNTTLTLGDFPFRNLANPNNNGSAVLRDNRLVAGSAGVFRIDFRGVQQGIATEDGDTVALDTAGFEVNGVRVRQATGRNTPSVINAVFNVRNFWDGRARDIFTGATPFGDSDQAWNAAIDGTGGLAEEPVRLDNASLASQAVGPALNGVEMSYQGRSWAQMARKLLSLQPLGRQKVAGDDSVLGPFAVADASGLNISYPALIRTAFQPRYWESEATDAAGYTQMERNFPLYWGLAIQAYESTLVSGETRYDRFLEGDTGALTALEQQGLAEFRGGGSQCTNCHMGPELTAASFTNFRRRSQVLNAALPDTLGFFRIGVSPVADDIGGADNDGFGNALFPNAPANLTQGVFKAPGLRNVELTGPYFHNGGQATIEQVVQFYGRRGDFPGDGNLGTGIPAINLNANERTQVAAFLRALTDDRVKYERAPFDHPSLCVPNGFEEDSPGVLRVLSGALGTDKWALIPESGRGGNAVPLQAFDELLLGVGSDGSRAHNLTQSCQP